VLGVHHDPWTGINVIVSECVGGCVCVCVCAERTLHCQKQTEVMMNVCVTTGYRLTD